MTAISRICLVGFGEVGEIFATDLKTTSLHAWDILFHDPDSSPSRRIANATAEAGSDCGNAVADCDLIISAVTAAQTLAAATAAAPTIKPDAWYFDLNSASPAMKRDAATVINNAGGRYVEGAVMSPIGPKRLATPILLGGPFAEAFLPLIADHGFDGVQHFSIEYGKASAAKMCRSVMVKGVEALLTESLVAARHYGVEETVLASLQDLFPGPDWPNLSAYMLSRSVQHGKRRAEEMREVAQTVQDAGLSPLMSAASAERHDWAAERPNILKHTDLDALLDGALESIKEEREASS